jgi:hypothetical protein
MEQEQICDSSSLRCGTSLAVKRGVDGGLPTKFPTRTAHQQDSRKRPHMGEQRTMPMLHGVTPLWWGRYDRSGKLLGFAMMEVASMPSARLRPAPNGIDTDPVFADGNWRRGQPKNCALAPRPYDKPAQHGLFRRG